VRSRGRASTRRRSGLGAMDQLRNRLYQNARRAARGVAIATGRCDLNGAMVAALWGSLVCA
jgi:hypothetical protein